MQRPDLKIFESPNIKQTIRIVALAVSLSVVAAGTAGAGSPYSCGQLIVQIDNIGSSTYTIDSPSCAHGYWTTVLAGKCAGEEPRETIHQSADGLRNSDQVCLGPGRTALVLLYQSSAWGPDCAVTLRAGGTSFKLEQQQNFCSSEAGSIFPSYSAGAPVARVEEVEGSYEYDRPGFVIWEIR